MPEHPKKGNMGNVIKTYITYILYSNQTHLKEWIKTQYKPPKYINQRHDNDLVAGKLIINSNEIDNGSKCIRYI